MLVVNNEICFRIMYYGLPLSGRSTTLETIHRRVNKYICHDFTHEQIVGHRGYQYFEFVSPRKINDMRIKYKLMRSPSFHSCFACGHYMTIDDYISDVETVLEIVDYVVFIVDSRQKCLDDNMGALDLLRDVAQKKDLKLDDILLAIQWNKRDLECVGLADIEELEAKINYLNVPSYQTVAVTGQGIITSFKKCMALVENRYFYS